MMNQIMLDIETLDRKNTAVIAQIAAVAFDPFTGETGEEFCVNIDPVSCQDAGLTIGADTVLFWLKQSDEARKAVFENAEKLDLFSALEKFQIFARQFDTDDENPLIVWANSPSFDIEILKTAFSKTTQSFPLSFRNERDFRTISKLFPDIAQAHVRTGIAHDALSDCKNQIAILQKCFFRIYGNFMKNTEGVDMPLTHNQLSKMIPNVENTEGV